MTTPRTTHTAAHAPAHTAARTDAAHAASGTLGARLWHLRLARSPLHANTLARRPSRSKVQPRLAAELVSRSVLKTPSTTAPFSAPEHTPARDNRHEAATRHAA